LLKSGLAGRAGYQKPGVALGSVLVFINPGNAFGFFLSVFPSPEAIRQIFLLIKI